MASSLESLGFHEWLCKTNFSFLAGASHPSELVKTIADCGYESFCVNDFDGAYGLARTHLELKRLEGEHLPTLHYGAEIHTEKDHQNPLLLQKNLVLVATSQKGYGNLCKILSRAHQKGKNDSFLTLDELLASRVEDLVLIQPMRGWVRWRQENPRIGELKEHFGGRFYMALSRHLHIAEDYWIGPTLDCIAKHQLLPLLSQDCFFHSPHQKSFSDVLNAIRMNKTVSECQDAFFPNGERYPQLLKNIERRFRELPLYQRSLEVSAELASSIDFSFDSLRYNYPQEMIPSGLTSQKFLEQLAWDGLSEKLSDPLPVNLVNQVAHELRLIEQLNFPDYFLTVWDIVRWARSQGILCQGRGSAANSAVCFGLGITSVNPHQFELLFERFISKERGDPPDIDVDFEHERREEVIQYIYRRYGRARAAMVANVITFKRKGAMRAVGKALGIGTDSLDRASKIGKSKINRGKSATAILGQLQFEEQSETLQSPLPWKSWEWFTERLKGFPRHLGIHSGGFIIAGCPLNDLVPQEPATMEGRTVIQWCKEDIEGLGFFKIDVLALGMLTALQKSFSLLKDHYGLELELHSIPEDDASTYQMITRADTVGVFQIESRAQMTMLPRMKPLCLYDLVIEVAIIRPGPIQGKVIHPYLRRRHGSEEVTYPDPCLEPILSRTLGIAIFQEQAMRIAVEVGDFTPGEAN
ncbi:MAG: PHP domain-containing protein, partial [Halobacteriovoraceae bacterium]|nr:PHP domain-containing protein [Halobacteriovoraceae bacterium]